MILQLTFLVEYKSQCFPLGFSRQPSTSTRAFQWKIFGFFALRHHSDSPKFLKLMCFLVFLVIWIQNTEKLLAWYLTSKSHWKASLLLTKTRLKQQEIWSLHYNPDRPKVPKVQIVSFLSMFWPSFHVLGVDFLPSMSHWRTLHLEWRFQLNNLWFWSLNRNQNSPKVPKTAVIPDSSRY